MTNPTPGDPAVKNAWGAIENEGRTIIDQAVSGITTINVAGSANVVVTSTPGSTAQDPATHFVLTGALTGNINVLWPNGKTRKFTVFNNTTGAFTLAVGANNGSGLPAGVTVSVAQGDTVEVVSNGTDITKTGISTVPAAVIPSGTVMGSFLQSSAPTGWTQNNSFNDKVIRLVDNTGTGGQSGGSWTIGGVTVAGTAITQAQLPNVNFTVSQNPHTHGPGTLAGLVNANVLVDSGANSIPSGASAGFPGSATVPVVINGGATGSANADVTVSSGGSGSTHTHAWSNDGTWRPAYVNSLVCAKD